MDMEILQIIDAIVGTIASILIASFVVIGFRNNIHQQKASVYLECTRRYTEIVNDFSDLDVYLSGDELKKSDSVLYGDYLNRYTSLLHQEYELYNNNFITQKIWDLWMDFYKEHMKTPYFEIFWNEKFKFYEKKDPSFAVFIDQALKDLE